MPKSRPLKMARVGPVAARTRLKLGSPMHKTPLIQYPHSWPLLSKAILFSKFQSQEIEDPHPSRGKKSNHVCQRQKNGIKRNKNSQFALQKKIRAQTSSIEPFRQPVGAGNKICSRPVSAINFRPAGGNFSMNISSNQYTHKSQYKRHGSFRKRRRAANNGRRKHRRARRKVRRSGRVNRRRKMAQRRRKKKRKKMITRRRRRNKENHDSSTEERRRLVEVDPPFGHAYDFMLKQKNAIALESYDSGNDEIKEDPLNVNDICRTLVKSLPGIPADCREDNFDEKTTRPEQEKLDQIKPWIRDTLEEASKKIREDHEKEGNNNMDDRNFCNRNNRPRKNRICIKEIKSYKRHANLKSKPERHRKQPKGCDQRGKRKCKPHLSQAKANNLSSRTVTGPPSRKNVFKSKRRKAKTKSTNDGNRKEDNKREFTDHEGKNIVHDNKIRKGPNAEKPIRRTTSSVSTTEKRDKRKMNTKDDDKKTMKTILPYPGKPVPQNKRREDIDIIRTHGKDISLLVKKVSQRQRNKPKNSPTKKKEIKKPKRHRGSSPEKQSRKTTAQNGRCCTRRGSHTSSVRSRSKKQQLCSAKISTSKKSRSAENKTGTADADGADENNNTNNNQTEYGSWGRVGNRLLRIGRYLLRKFQVFIF